MSPNSITKYSKYLYRVLNTVFYSSPSFIRIRLYAPYRFSVVNYSTPYNLSYNSNISGNGYPFLMVISLSFR